MSSNNSTPSKYLTTSSKSTLTLKCRLTLPTSHYSKHQSKIKSQKKIITTKQCSKCLDNVNKLVRDAKSIVGKYIKSKYLVTVKKLKVIRYNNKVTQLDST